MRSLFPCGKTFTGKNLTAIQEKQNCPRERTRMVSVILAVFGLAFLAKIFCKLL